MKKYVYSFKEADGTDRVLFGGKGANLAEMTKIGLPVPQGFLITTETCIKYFEENRVLSKSVVSQIEKALEKLEKQSGKKFGSAECPLLVSVRSGARVSMPGMMDTILNLGLNDETAKGIAKLTKNEKFALDSYRRFIQMYANVVKHQDINIYESILEQTKKQYGVEFDKDLSVDALKEVVKLFKNQYKQAQKEEFPQDPKVQLIEAVEAVFRSWDNERAEVYRRIHDIPYNWGTGVCVQSMVFGNMGNDCMTGVAFSRNPATGEKKVYGEYLVNAQGEDVVAGVRTPQKIEELAVQDPEIYSQFINILDKLEKHYKDMQEVEFTIEKGKLYILQTRSGKRTAKASLKIAVDFVEEKLLDKKMALLLIDPKQLETLLHPTFKEESLQNAKEIGTGLPASPGAGCGKICFSANRSKELNAKKIKNILVRHETSPEDIEGLIYADGLLTARGGMTSHAAVIARGMGACCVAGCEDLIFAEDGKSFVLGGQKFKEGDVISLDGTTGKVYQGEIETETTLIAGNLSKILTWANEIRDVKVRANADNQRDASLALSFGAEGVGLCRTEHMFFDEDRITAMREMIISSTKEERQKALDKLLPIQIEDFKNIFKTMKELPVTIRLLDPPLHEFLPKDENEIKELAKSMKLSYQKTVDRINILKETNPMMGHRGIRIAVTYPEIAKMQTEAIIRASIEIAKELKINISPEIMVPLSCDCAEFKYVKDVITSVADRIIKENKSSVSYTIGTMIEIPRAAISADQIAKFADFFSFGTNDLTQMTYGFSRDDAGSFLDDYYDKKIFEINPFKTIDKGGVGKLIRIAVELGKSTRPEIKLGICGEHAGDPASIEFFHRIGLNYVSCSAYRVPIAILACAQAEIRYPRKKKGLFQNKNKKK